MSNEMTRWDDQQGFSLLEVLISLSVFTIVIFAVYTTFTASHRTFVRGEDKIELQQTSRVAMGMAASEIRTAGYDPSNPPVIPGLASPTAIQVANANTLTFIADVDGNSVTDQVTYRLQGTQLIRDLASWNGATFPAPAPEQLADGVTTLTFAYFDSSNNPTATLANIRRITIGLTVQGTGVGGQQSLPLTMDVRLRNVQ
jgi:prepilin-type N-terminal cleavage/methylation domain-containing protein